MSLTALEAELYGALQNILNGIDTGLVRIDTDADETWNNALARARRAVAKAGAPSGPVICPECRGERRGSDGRLCGRCSGNAQIDRSKLRAGECAPFEGSGDHPDPSWEQSVP